MQITRLIALSALGILVLLLLGCASAARTDNMVAPNELVASGSHKAALSQTLRVASVSGGKSTNPMWKSRIGNAEFQAALEKSLSTAKLIAASSDGVKYLLSADLVRVDQPWFGASFTVTMTVEYKLKEAATGLVVWRESIAASHTATMSDSFMALTRLRLANEGAARANIAQLIETLNLLKFGT